MHTAQDKFVAHIFNCEPSSGPLCKTIEAACKVSASESYKYSLNMSSFLTQLRYQKCLDAHPNHPNREYIDDSPTSTKGLGATIKNFVSSFSLKKDKSSSWERAKSLQVNSMSCTKVVDESRVVLFVVVVEINASTN